MHTHMYIYANGMLCDNKYNLNVIRFVDTLLAFFRVFCPCTPALAALTPH